MSVHYNPPSGSPQNGRALNRGVVAPEGRTLYVTGQVAWDHRGALVGSGDVRAQMAQCVENVRQVLEPVGAMIAVVEEPGR